MTLFALINDNQGHIVSAKGDTIEVQLFSWLTGFETDMKTFKLSEINSIKLFSDQDEFIRHGDQVMRQCIKEAALKEKKITVRLTVTDHLNPDDTQDKELNARAVIEQAIYVLYDNKLAGPDEIAEALNWWKEEVFEVCPKEEHGPKH